jgi:tetratricopeptide (TPR) repeat protein
MSIRRATAALAAALLVAGGGWLLTHAKKSSSDAAPESSRAWNTIHEKVFLTEQLRRNPGHTPILLRLAQIERSQGDLRAAREHLEQAVTADGRQADVYLELGLVCWEMGDFAAAEEQNRAVLRIDPGQPDALYNLGAISANRGDAKQAREFWLNAVRSGRNTDAADKSRAAIARLEAMR